MANGGDNIVRESFVDTLLTNYSETYIADASQYISNAVATVIPVTQQSGSFMKFERSYFLRDEMAPRPHGGAPVQARFGLAKGTYAVDEYALEHMADDRDRARAAGTLFNLDATRVAFLTQKALIRRDRLWASTFFKTGVWGTDLNGLASGSPVPGVSFLRWDQAGSNPLQDILLAADQAAAKTGKRPNVMVLGANVITRLRLNPAINEFIKYTTGGVPTEQLLAQMFGVDRLVVARSVYNSADETMNPGDSENIQYIVDANSAWIGYVEPTAGMEAPTATAMFVWTGLEGGLANAQGGVIRVGRDDRASSDWYQIKDAMQYQAVAPELGLFFNNAVGTA